MTMSARSPTPGPASQDAASRRVNGRPQPGRRAFRPRNLTLPAVRVTVPGPDGGRRAMSTGAGIFLITVGAILLFALTADASPRWINLHTVGLILILAGVLGLTLPRLSRSPGSSFRRWVVPMLPSGDESAGEPDLIRRPGADDDRPTLADELLGDEHDPPIGTGEDQQAAGPGAVPASDRR
jgi:hypothetical protein